MILTWDDIVGLEFELINTLEDYIPQDKIEEVTYKICAHLRGFALRKLSEREMTEKTCDNCLLNEGEQCDILVPSKNCKYWKPKLKEGE